MAAKARTYYIVEGTSEPQDYQLQDDGENVIGTGYTVGLTIYKEGVVPDSPPTVAWLSQAGGTVRVSGCESLTSGEYHVRFSLTDASSKVGYIPSGSEADRWVVVKVYA